MLYMRPLSDAQLSTNRQQPPNVSSLISGTIGVLLGCAILGASFLISMEYPNIELLVSLVMLLLNIAFIVIATIARWKGPQGFYLPIFVGGWLGCIVGNGTLLAMYSLDTFSYPLPILVPISFIPIVLVFVIGWITESICRRVLKVRTAADDRR